MKPLILLVLSGVIITPALATISVNAQWDVRSSGSNQNGGFFVTGATGTDYSLQDTAQWAVTDAVTNGTTTITSATATFTSAIVGNGCYAAGGTGTITGAWYEVVTFTNSTTIVVDRANGLSAGTGATLNCGGSLATPAAALVTAAALHIWVKSGTYTQTTATSVDVTLEQFITGYSTTHGDITLSSQLTRPLLTTATNSTILWRLGGSLTDGVLTIRNLSFSNTASTRAYGFNAESARVAIRVENCSFDGFSTALHGDFSVDWNWRWLELTAVEVKNSTGVGIFNQGGSAGNYMTLRYCWIHNNGSHGISQDGPGLYLINSVFSGNTGSGVYGAATIDFLVSLNSNYVSNTVSGIDATSGVGHNVVGAFFAIQLTNSIFYGNGAYGVDLASSPYIAFNAFNAYGSNTTAARHNFSAGVSDVTLTANPFTNSGSGDFSLNSTAGGGSALRSAGYPGLFPGGSSTGYYSIGAITPLAGVVTSTVGFPTR